MAKRTIPCSIHPGLNRVTFEETADVPVPGDRIMSACGMTGKLLELTPSHVVIAWDKRAPRTYTAVRFGAVI